MNTKHTPGPWNISHGANLYPSIGSLSTHTKICDLPDDMDKRGNRNDEVLANARLIKSAPRLLNELIQYVEFKERSENRDKDTFYHSFKAAIKEATE